MTALMSRIWSDITKSPTRLLFVLFIWIRLASTHDACEFQRVKLGTAKSPAACQSLCIDFETDDEDSTRDCIAWGYRSESEECSGWLMETEPEDQEYFYDLKYWYYEGGVYDPTPTVFDECDLALQTNLSVAHTRGAQEKKGCFFKLVNMGFSKSPEDCQRFCEGFVSNIHGGCLAWSHSDEDLKCAGLLSKPSRKYDSCGRV